MNDEVEAYVRNARVQLAELAGTVHDGLTGRNDLFLKVGLLQDIDAVDKSLRAALS